MLAVNVIEEKLSPRHHHTKMTASKDLKKNKSIKINTQQFTDILKNLNFLMRLSEDVITVRTVLIIVTIQRVSFSLL